VDSDVRAWVGSVIGGCERHLGEGLVGVYVHGSLAFGCYVRPKSDLDVLVVSAGALTPAAREGLAADVLTAFEERPTVGGLELSVVTAADAAHFAHPTPYEWHFSEVWAHDVRAGRIGGPGVDADLAAHVTVTRACGIGLVAPPPGDLFGAVPHDSFLNAVFDDLAWIVDAKNIIESPIYATLNICRSIELLRRGPGTVSSKVDGAQWALADGIPATHHAVIRAALACYLSSAAVSDGERRRHGHGWDTEALLGLAAFARQEVFDR
jgi:streptomycin 3"-adenylyltransferase